MVYQKLTDESLMPFGDAHKGTPMADVPASYLMYLYDDGLKPGNVRTYIEENMDSITKEINDARRT